MRSVLIEQPAASDTIKKFRNATSEGKKALLVFPVLRVKSLMWLSEYKTAAAYGQALNFRIREDVGKGDLHAWAHCCRLLGDVTTLQKEPHLALYAAHLFVNECSEFSKPSLQWLLGVWPYLCRSPEADSPTQFAPSGLYLFSQTPWSTRPSIWSTHPKGDYLGWWLVEQGREGLSQCHLQSWLLALPWSHPTMIYMQSDHRSPTSGWHPLLGHKLERTLFYKDLGIDILHWCQVRAPATCPMAVGFERGRKKR